MMDSETTFQNLLDSQILNHVLIRELRYQELDFIDRLDSLNTLGLSSKLLKIG